MYVYRPGNLGAGGAIQVQVDLVHQLHNLPR